MDMISILHFLWVCRLGLHRRCKQPPQCSGQHYGQMCLCHLCEQRSLSETLLVLVGIHSSHSLLSDNPTPPDILRTERKPYNGTEKKSKNFIQLASQSVETYQLSVWSSWIWFHPWGKGRPWKLGKPYTAWSVWPEHPCEPHPSTLQPEDERRKWEKNKKKTKQPLQWFVLLFSLWWLLTLSMR